MEPAATQDRSWQIIPSPDFDIRDTASLNELFASIGKNIGRVIHTAAQTSHGISVDRHVSADSSIASDPLQRYG